MNYLKTKFSKVNKHVKQVSNILSPGGFVISSHSSQNGYQENHDKDAVTSLRRKAGTQVLISKEQQEKGFSLLESVQYRTALHCTAPHRTELAAFLLKLITAQGLGGEKC